MKAVEEESPTSTLPPLLQEAEDAEKLLRKPTKFEMMRRFKSRKTKRKSTIMHPSHLTEVSECPKYSGIALVLICLLCSLIGGEKCFLNQSDARLELRTTLSIFFPCLIQGFFIWHLKYFVSQQVVANQEGSQMSGYLKYKKGKFGWKKSWFVLKDNVLYSYKASSVS